MQRIFTIMFAAMLAGQVMAQTTFNVDGLKYTITDEKKHEVSVGKSSYNSPSGDLEIPSYVRKPGGVTYTVTSIDNCAFYSCSRLTSVTIPNSITSIGESAFNHCSGLTEIIIPNSVTSIEYSTFAYCRGLTSVTIPNSVTSIGKYAFDYCDSLTEVTIPILLRASVKKRSLVAAA